jgi:uncharacterized protein YukE
MESEVDKIGRTIDDIYWRLEDILKDFKSLENSAEELRSSPLGRLKNECITSFCKKIKDKSTTIQEFVNEMQGSLNVIRNNDFQIIIDYCSV